MSWREFVRDAAKSTQIHFVSDNGFWVFHDATRATTRMTQRNKHHLYHVWVVPRGASGYAEQAVVERDINMVSRTHWPVERTPQGHFAKGHTQNVRLVKDDRVIIQSYGSHQLLLEGDTPSDSAWMTWDDRPIDLDTLVGLLNFERHPDRPESSFEAEMMHKPRLKTPTLFDAGAHEIDEHRDE